MSTRASRYDRMAEATESNSCHDRDVDAARLFAGLSAATTEVPVAHNRDVDVARLSAGLSAATTEVLVAREGSRAVSNETTSTSVFNGVCSSATGGECGNGPGIPVSHTSTGEVPENENLEAPANPIVGSEPQAGSNLMHMKPFYCLNGEKRLLLSLMR
ncbi:hypothetical protein V6N11_000098 [Hibiscus sabdariffa]|uniref:Uncharacterized protein n=1 Tax=Hibiscus sabdariffa TaxID=183260 RepID=A0ABR2NNM6_9ROSI